MKFYIILNYLILIESLLSELLLLYCLYGRFYNIIENIL